MVFLVVNSVMAGISGKKSFSLKPRTNLIISAVDRILFPFISFVRMCFLYPIGVSEALSAPPAITTCACPVAISPMAATMALLAEIHACVTV